MSKLVVMPESDWTAALDSLRAKMSSSNPIKSGDVAALIDGLVTIGAGGSFTAFASGTVTPSSDVSGAIGLTITHGLGVTPNFFLIFADTFMSSASKANLNFQVAVTMPEEKSTSSCGVYGAGYGYSSITVVDIKTLKKQGAGDYNGSSDKYVSDIFAADTVKVQAGLDRVVTGNRKYYWLCGVMSME